MSRVWVDPVWPQPGDGTLTVREAVGDVVGDVCAKATAYVAEIDAEHPTVQRVRRVLTLHRYVCGPLRCRCSWQPPDRVADPRVQHEHHVAEQLAAAGLLDGAAS